MVNKKRVFKDSFNVVKKAEDSPFDDYNATINQKLVGDALRERLSQILALHATVAKKLAWYEYLKGASGLSKKSIKDQAFKELSKKDEYKKLSITKRNELSEGYKIKVGGKKTSFFQEGYNELVYGYHTSIGKAKLREIEKSLETARSMLSWDKQAIKGGI